MYNPKINTDLPIFLATTTNNTNDIIQFDFSKLPIDIGSGINIIIPLDPGKSILIDSLIISRGSLTDGTDTNQTNQLSIDKVNWLNYNATFLIDVYTWTFLSSGSPILMQITTTPVNIPLNTPLYTPLDTPFTTSIITALTALNESTPVKAIKSNPIYIYIFLGVSILIILLYISKSRSDDDSEPSKFSRGE